ncbi:MAG: redoxin domain-containing protein [Planctomycetes bacterium]|nr:redoxin domain-containing protein [Planctomycetota bacterium]
MLLASNMNNLQHLLRAGLASLTLFTVAPLAVAAPLVLEEPAPAAQAPAPKAERAFSLMVGDAAPALAVKKYIKGEEIKSFEKGQIYVVEYWATWCGPCRATIPHLTELQAKHGSKVKFIGVSVWERDQAKVEPFVAEMGDKMVYSIAMDDVAADDKRGSNGKMAQGWMTAAGRNGIPSAFVVDGNGKIAWIGHPMSGMEETIDQLLAGKFDLAKATADYAKAAALQAQAAAAQKELDTAMRAKDYKTAIAVLDRLLESDQSNLNLAMTKFTVLLNAMKDYDAASAYGAKLVEGAFKDSANGLNALAWTIVDPNATPEKRDLPLALRAATRAVELLKDGNPMLASVLDTLARVHFAMGDLAKAIETQQKAVDVAPEQAKAELQQTLDEYKAAGVKG